MAEGIQGQSTAPPTGRPFGLVLLAVIYDMYAVFLIVAGVGLGLRATGVGAAPNAHFAILAVFPIAWGVWILHASYSLWKGLSWARRDFNILLALGVLASVFQIRQHPAIALLQLIVFIGFLFILNIRPSTDYFRR